MCTPYPIQSSPIKTHLVLLRVSELRLRDHVEHHQHSGRGDGADQVSGHRRLRSRRRDGAGTTCAGGAGLEEMFLQLTSDTQRDDLTGSAAGHPEGAVA